VNGMVLNCPTCDARWPVGANVGEFERQNLEQAACPHCGKHTLRCVTMIDRRRRAYSSSPNRAGSSNWRA
jgi:DNA-directed RNA polymerase subunit RPC12/RpoP